MVLYLLKVFRKVFLYTANVKLISDCACCDIIANVKNSLSHHLHINLIVVIFSVSAVKMVFLLALLILVFNSLIGEFF